MSRRKEPDLGPYLIEAPTFPWGGFDTTNCEVVDTRQPNPDPLGEGGKGWVSVFTGSFEECDAWLEANS